LEQLLEALQPDDVLVVWRLDRLARDISDVLEVLVQVLVLGAGLVSLKDGIDSDLLGSEGLLVVVRALLSHRGHVEAERALAERQRRLDALRGPGRPGSMSDAKWAEARECFEAGETSVARVAGKIGVCRQALYRKRRAEGT
jgi:DNA invertase Pin-like site-specific DNA recombinase